MLGFLTLLKESWGIKMSERQADSMKGPVLLEVFLPWLKNNDFFVCQVQGINTPAFPLFCRFPLIYKQATKASLFLPSITFLIQTSFLFGVLFLTSIWFFLFLYGLLSLFTFKFLTFFYFWIVSLYGTISMSRSFFLLLPLCYVPHIIHHLHFYLFLFQLLFLYLRPPFPLLDSPVPIEMFFDQTSSPYSLLKETEETFPTRMEQKGQNRNRTERWQTEPGKGTFSHVNNFPILCWFPAVSSKVCMCPSLRTRQTQRKGSRGK